MFSNSNCKTDLLLRLINITNYYIFVRQLKLKHLLSCTCSCCCLCFSSDFRFLCMKYETCSTLYPFRQQADSVSDVLHSHNVSGHPGLFASTPDPVSLTCIDKAGPSSEADMHSTFNHSSSCLWQGAESGLPLGNQFAKADAQQDANFCGLQLLSNTHWGLFFLFLHHLLFIF